MHREILAITLAVGCAVTLGGCFLVPRLPPDVVRNPVSEEHRDVDDSILSGPDGWRQLEHCSGAPDVPWFWVDGFPSQQLDAVGIVPDCGDTWPQDDGEHFVNATTYSVRVDELDALDELLEAAGWEQTVEDVDGTRLVARDYYRTTETEYDTRFAIELYQVSADGYTAYMDYLSPGTRTVLDE